MSNPTENGEMQFDNPEAPNYDWKRDREWFNQRLASERLRNAALHNRIRALRAWLKDIKGHKARAALADDDLARKSNEN
jgi:hypothetical protein